MLTPSAWRADSVAAGTEVLLDSRTGAVSRPAGKLAARASAKLVAPSPRVTKADDALLKVSRAMVAAVAKRSAAKSRSIVNAGWYPARRDRAGDVVAQLGEALVELGAGAVRLVAVAVALDVLQRDAGALGPLGARVRPDGDGGRAGRVDAVVAELEREHLNERGVHRGRGPASVWKSPITAHPGGHRVEAAGVTADHRCDGCRRSAPRRPGRSGRRRSCRRCRTSRWCGRGSRRSRGAAAGLVGGVGVRR